MEDIFDQVQAPCWAESLEIENENYEETDDNFFLSPVPPIVSVQPVPRPTGPVTRSQTRAAAMVTPQPAPVERRSRDMARNAVAVKRQPSPALTAARRAASPAPTQQEFNTALSQRASSLGQGAKLPVSVRNSQTRTVAPRNSSATRIAAPPVCKPTIPTRPNPLARARAPVTVTKSPTTAFGSAVRPKPQTARTSVIRPREVQTTPKAPILNRAAPLRVYPTPSGQTPNRHLTQPKTPVVAKRTSSVTRQPIAAQPATPKTADRKALCRRDIQGMVERLSKPKTITSITRPPTTATPRRTIPNTYTHGIQTTQKVRSRSNSRPPSQNENLSAVTVGH